MTMEKKFGGDATEKKGVQEPRDRAEKELLRGALEQLLEEQAEEKDLREQLAAAKKAEEHHRRKNEALDAGLRELQRMAESDDLLTNLLNRVGFEKALAKLREKGINGALLVIDIDKFKEINDTNGHAGGDLVLMATAERLLKICRDTDLIARWGGDEILIFFPEATAEQVLEKFSSEQIGRSVINITLKRPNGLPAIEITFSGGVTDLEPDENVEDAIHRADTALYRAKKAGRNRLELAPITSESAGEEAR